MTESPIPLDEFANRYISLWNEPDPEVRSKLIRDLWAPGGGQVLVDPPENVRDAASQLEFPIPTFDVHGYDGLDARVSRAYEMFVAPGENRFELAGPAERLLDHVAALRWSLVSRSSGEVVGAGVNVVALDADGKVRTDYLFVAA